MPARLAVLVALLLVVSGWARAQNEVVRGFVTSAEDGLALPGASVVLQPIEGDTAARYGGAADEDGLYVIPRVPVGRYALRASHVGFATLRDTVRVTAGDLLRLDLRLRPADERLGDVVVEGSRPRDAIYRAGVERIEPADIELVPSPGGVDDLAAYLTTVPGVVSTGDTGGQLFIRGGEPGQNLVLLDGIPIYQPFHVLGFYSVFPADIVGTADFYAGGFGARYGSRLSSVLEVTSRNGNLRRVEAEAEASPFVSGLRAEFPIVRDRASVLASGRISLLDGGASELVGEPLPYRFGDAFLKLHGRLMENSHLSVTGLYTEDAGRVREPTPERPVPAEVGWRNFGLGLRYLFLPGTSPFRGEITVGLTRLDTDLTEADRRFPDRASRVEKWSSRMEITQYGAAHQIRAGLFAGTTLLRSDLGAFDASNGETLTDAGLYIEPEFDLGRGVRLTTGVRVHTFPSLSDTFVEPRLRAAWRRGVHQVDLAAGIYHQELVGITDRRDAAGVFTAWTPAPVGEVEEAIHLLGGYRVVPTAWLTLSVEGYAKWLSNLAVAEWTPYPRFTENLQPADGRAQGIDLRAEVQRAGFRASVGYSLAAVRYRAMQRQLPVWFDTDVLEYQPTHDRRHQINALIAATLAGFDVSVRWQFGSGLPFSRAAGFDRFLFLDGGVDVFETPAETRVIYERPFNARLPAYHRLDVSVERRFDVGAAALTLHAGVINAYDRANVFYYDVFTLGRVDQLPLLPSFGLKLER